MLRALIVVALVGLALGYPVNEAGHAQPSAQVSQEKASKDVPPRSPPPLLNVIDSRSRNQETLQSKTQARDEENRAKRDLAAQEDMAKWSFWMMIVAGVGTLLTTVGVGLVWRTLHHTRRAADFAGETIAESQRTSQAAIVAGEAAQEANRLTRDAQREARTTARWEARKTRRREEIADKRAEAAYAIAERNANAAARHVEVALQTSYAQLRPWLKLDVKGNVFRRMNEAENIVSISVTISNAGVSPAFNAGVSMSVRLICWTGELGPIDVPHNLGMFAPIFPGEPMPHECSWQPKLAEIRAITDEALAVGGMPTIVFDFKISYRASFSDEIKETAFRYMIFGPPGDVEWLARPRPINADITPRMEFRRQSDDIMT